MAKPYVPYEGPIVTRAEAKAKGLKRYYPWSVCKRGHIAEHYTSSGQCCECHALRSKAIYAANPDYIRECFAPLLARDKDWERKAKAAWNENNRNRREANAARWFSDNPGIRTVYARNRRAKIKAAGGIHSLDDIREIRAAQSDKCAYCRRSLRGKGHVDHIVPIASGGSNERRNLQLTCQRCNHKKHVKTAVEFARMMGLLI